MLPPLIMVDLIDSFSLFNLSFIAPILCLAVALLALHRFITRPSHKVFLLDFTCYKPPVAQAVTKEEALDIFHRCYKIANEEAAEFLRKNIHKSGLGDSTYFPEPLLKDPPDQSMEGARRESELAIFGAVDKLLVKTKVNCKDIGILVVNCCLFNVTPSLSSMIVNKYKLRDSIASYSLSGMGCSAGLVAIGLAKQLLQVHHNSYALVVSTEIVTPYVYIGNESSMCMANAVFRVGGAAILLSNRPSDSQSSKYQLMHIVHSHTASSDSSYNCIMHKEDEEGHGGIVITKDLLIAAANAIKFNITSLAPLVLPISEQVYYLLNCFVRRLHVANIKPYVPDFKRAFDHFLPHVGGSKMVLDELKKNLGFGEDDMEASRMTLYRFGNTASSSVWYALAYKEAKEKIKKGDRVWQMAFGSGFKCSSVIWRAIRTINREEMNPWSDEIDGFPVDLKNMESFIYFNSKVT